MKKVITIKENTPEDVFKDNIKLYEDFLKKKNIVKEYQEIKNFYFLKEKKIFSQLIDFISMNNLNKYIDISYDKNGIRTSKSNFLFLFLCFKRYINIKDFILLKNKYNLCFYTNEKKIKNKKALTNFIKYGYSFHENQDIDSSMNISDDELLHEFKKGRLEKEEFTPTFYLEYFLYRILNDFNLKISIRKKFIQYSKIPEEYFLTEDHNEKEYPYREKKEICFNFQENYNRNLFKSFIESDEFLINLEYGDIVFDISKEKLVINNNEIHIPNSIGKGEYLTTFFGYGGITCLSLLYFLIKKNKIEKIDENEFKNITEKIGTYFGNSNIKYGVKEKTLIRYLQKINKFLKENKSMCKIQIIKNNENIDLIKTKLITIL